MKRNIGNYFIVALVLLNIAVWLVFPPINDGRPNFLRQYVGEVIGANNIILMACSLFLSTRPKWAEPFFGGLDKMYLTHRHTGTAAFLLIFAHVLTVPIRTTGWLLGNYLAVIAFTGIVTIVLITLAPRIPFLNRIGGRDYNDWKKLKRFIGIFFIIAFIHSLNVQGLSALVAITWVMVFFIIGTASYLYTEVFSGLFKKSLPYTVEAVKHPNLSSTEVTLRPKKSSMKRHRAGQFLFIRFPRDKALNESHPFTISSAPCEDVLRLTIKASGNFTRELFEKLQAGTDAVIEGPYGMFNYKSGAREQIWIAGGIGLTPFLSFVRDLQEVELKHDVNLFYTVRHPEEAIFVEELQAAGLRYPRLKVHVRYSAKEGSLTVEDILQKAGGDVRRQDIYLCGPLAMIQAFEKKFLELGVPKDMLHYEEFNFR